MAEYWTRAGRGPWTITTLLALIWPGVGAEARAPGAETRVAALDLPAYGTNVAPAPQEPARDTSREALEIFDTLSLFGDPEPWPRYDLESIPVAIYDGQRTWLYRHPSPPAPFARHASADGVWVMEGQHPAVRGNSSARIGNAETATLLLGTLTDFPSVRDRAGVAIHEGFHVFQRQTHPEWNAGGMGFENPATDTHLLALRRIETALLHEAVAATRAATAAPLARAALDVRQERFAGLPPAVVEFERGIELLEGTAQHVQVTATGSRAGLMALPEHGFGPDSLHMRSYAAGLALATLLERFWPGWEWAVEHGRHPSLDAALDHALARLGCDAAPWRDRYQPALARAEADITRLEARRDSLRRDLLARDGWRITIVAPAEAPLQLRGMDPMNLTRLGDGEILHSRWVRVGHPTGSAEVLDRAALTAGIDAEPIARG
ncbi:MAG: hypothetical protein ACOC3J_07200, partial [Gemmatimonadota bacterium]